MRDVYEDQSKAQALIRYLVKADARPNTNMAIFKTYVLKRQGSAVGTSVRQPARPPAASSTSAPPPAAIRAGVQQTATVKALLARGKHLSPSQLVRKLMSPVKPYPLLQSTLPPPAAEPPAKHLARRQLFTTGTFVPTAEHEEDDEELVFAASQCEAQLNTGVTTEAHPLYGIFMAHLSTCIFQWDAEDVAALCRAKEGELSAKKTCHVSERAFSACIS
ncbi:Epithelial-stromal interaction 1 [Labeo rohita]|uniref:Epithelial-stromal interaction 1 n=1 Tax=Labeo rohita TaxID=84645 RepID=A0A498NK14_LABRO|nr:Epithelial-stromal interaction 1 [Labeo rohita]